MSRLKVAALALAMLTLAGSSQPSLAAPFEVTFNAGSIGGTFFIMGTAFTAAWEEKIPGFSGVVVPGGSFGNIINVSKDKSGRQMGLATTPMLRDAWNGLHEFGEQGFKNGITNIRALSNLGYGATFHFVVTSRIVPQGVTTLGEFLKTKPRIRVSVGPRGTGGEIGVRRVLESYGVTYDDIKAWGGNVQFTDYSDAISAIMDGHLDGLWNNFPPYHPGITELAFSRDITLLSIDDDKLAFFEKEYQWPRATMKPGVYNKVDRPVHTSIEHYVVFAHENLPEELAYQMTKIILTNKDRWVKAFMGMQAFEPETGWVVPIPLHKGAERAFKELGYL
ncbi:MAG: TAXI family TRAP transporter solute-binding subunit [Firmicutes bacterium]|nr:TAXI family TRAP transporter solute-binding subunit [Bacillota bacterium]